MNKVSTFVMGAAIGCAAGALAALALAPQSGAQTREFVVSRAGSVAEDAVDFSTAVSAYAKRAGSTVAQGAQEKFGGVANKAKQVMGGGKAQSDPSDELREKIAAARERIAEQIAQNAASAEDEELEEAAESEEIETAGESEESETAADEGSSATDETN